MQFRISLHKLKNALNQLEFDVRRSVCKKLGIQSNTRNSERIYLDFRSFTTEIGQELAENLLYCCKLTSNQQLIISGKEKKFPG